MTETELANLVERGYVPHGGSHIIHFIGSTPMPKPDVYVPLQFHSQRKLAPGDVVFCELSAAFWGYSGQVLRTFAVEAEPTQLYRDLHVTAEAVFDAITKRIRPGTTVAELIDATSIIEANGFTTCDDVVHGYGGGYFQPIIGSRSRPAANQPEITLRENMCMVVQPGEEIDHFGVFAEPSLVFCTSWNDHDVAGAADPLFAAEAELHLALEHPHDLLICVTVRLDMDASADAPPDDHRLVDGENAAADLLGDLFLSQLGEAAEAL